MASSSRPNHDTYQVFLSFRGDTRYAFTDHLYHALRRAGVKTFRDEEEIESGQQLKPGIDIAIINSKASIVVLSPDYANSRWCLNELCLILEQKEHGHAVIPVFYLVDPSDVRHQTGSFAMNELNGTNDDLKRWKEALQEVGNLKGDVLHLARQTYETDFIDKVVEKVKRKLYLKLEANTPAYTRLIGMESRIEDINSVLKNEQYDAIAIFGIGGIGKTTIAYNIYKLNKHYFESSSFVSNIGENYKGGLLRLQEKILKDLCWKKEISISCHIEGTNEIVKVLQTTKVLIVLDDISDRGELDTLLGTNVFHRESKIIITTRLSNIDEWFGSKSSRCKMHALKSLNVQESLELLSQHAFPSGIPIDDFKVLGKKLSQYCGGNPLALKVVGSSLFVSDDDPCKRKDVIDSWLEKVNQLNSFKGNIDSSIQLVLRKSFDSLPELSHKELFLHIACFFVGEYQEHVISILKDDLYTNSGIGILVKRGLLTVSHSDHIMMHQLIQEMGRKIVCDESEDPEKRSRVWNDDESYDLLSKGKVSDTIKGLSLDIQKVKKKVRQETTALQTDSLAKMDKLKLLQLKYVKLTGSYKNFPELRWLCWHGCPLETMCAGLLKSILVALDMSYGNMETFEVPTVLDSLKILKLEGCDKLVSMRMLHRLPKLETLVLCYCSSLIHLCESIKDHKSLVLLDLKWCIKLLKASSRPTRPWIFRRNSGQPFLSLPCSLKFLYLNYCHIEYNNDVQVAFHPSSFFNLCLECNTFEFLPSSIDYNMLRTLDLNSCSRLKSLPCIPSTLEELYVEWCSSLEKITFQSGHFSLQQFSYRGCFKLSEVQSLFKLVPIAKIDEADLIQHMRWIKKYEHHKLDLVGDEITKGRSHQHIQMLYEYGIMSTYLQGIKDQNMMTYKYTSSSNLLSFRVPSHHEHNRIQGLHVSCLYKSSDSKDKDRWFLLAKISNRSKGFTWIYNPVVYYQPRVNEDAVWLSYWPIGNNVEAGDEIHVDIIVEDEVIVSGCGASLVYTDDGEVDEEVNCENNSMKEEEVIGGDLTEFEVTKGGYYLCRRDLFGSQTSTRLKWLFGDNIYYPESQGWNKTRQTRMRIISDLSRGYKKIVVRVNLSSEKRKQVILKAICRRTHFDSAAFDVASGRLTVTGDVDPAEVDKYVRKIDNEAVILHFSPIHIRAS